MSEDMRFHIEIEVDNVDRERMEALTEAVQINGGTLFAAFLMIAGENPKPKITLWAENMTAGRIDVPLHRPEGE